MDTVFLAKSGGWMGSRVNASDVVVTLLGVLALTYIYLGNAFQKQVPSSYWNQVPQSSGELASSRQQKAHERRLGYVFEQYKLDFAVLWGSQSGRSEMIARQLAKSLQDRFGLKVLAADLDDFEANSLVDLKQSQPCAFIVSTYGDGDPPDGADGLWSFVHAEKDKNTLASLRYVIFGLGNSNYRQYNHVARTTDARLQELGAARFGHIGAGDDAHDSTETDFHHWRKETETLLQQVLGLTERSLSYHPSFAIQEDGTIPVDKVHVGFPFMTAQAVSPPTTATVKAARKLWETEDRLCIHMDLDLGSDRQLKYKTGDHLVVWPRNPDHEVETLLKHLGHLGNRHSPITVKEVAATTFGKTPCPSPTTLDALFRDYLEISGKLSIDLVGALAEFAPSETARAQLSRLSNDPTSFKETISGQHLTLTGLLVRVGGDDGAAAARKWDIPISFLIERLKPMQPRYYSISSSAVVNPRIATITAVVDKPSPSSSLPLTTTHDHDHHQASNHSPPPASNCCRGLTTSYLWALERALNYDNNKPISSSTVVTPPSYSLLDAPRDGTLTGAEGRTMQIHCTTRPTSFKLPIKSSSPIIMIGAGTGVAPFRAFVQERVRRCQNEEVGRTMLFMGFRHADVDFIYRDEWKEWRDRLNSNSEEGGEKKKTTFDYWLACSRDGDGDEKRIKGRYVQDLLREKEEEVMDLLLGVPSCRLFVCGSAAMARDVVGVLVEMKCRRDGGSGSDDNKDGALEWVRKMRQFGTLLEDVWG